jgi:hypothetical protein
MPVKKEAPALFDIFILDSKDVIKDITISDYISKFKDISDVMLEESRKEGDMYLYQQTYMDETDLTKHEFREK